MKARPWTVAPSTARNGCQRTAQSEPWWLRALPDLAQTDAARSEPTPSQTHRYIQHKSQGSRRCFHQIYIYTHLPTLPRQILTSLRLYSLNNDRGRSENQRELGRRALFLTGPSSYTGTAELAAGLSEFTTTTISSFSPALFLS